MEKIKIKKKLTKAQKIIKGILFGASAVLLVLAIVFTFVKEPIEGSIYKTNTTFQERETIWESEYDRLFDIYDASYSVEYFEQFLEPATHSVGQILYKYSISGNYLTFKLYNNSTGTATIYSAKLENKDDSSIKYTILVEDDLASKETFSNTLEVADGFDIEDYYIYCSYRYNGHLWSGSPISSYQHQLERTKIFKIGDMIRDEIGERPDNIKENSQDERPEYMDVIVNARLKYALLYMFAGITFFIACVFGIERFKRTTSYGLSPSPQVEVIIKEIKVKDEHSEEECKHRHQIKKVVCLYCGSRYKDSLDECPDCGSSRIKEEPKEELENISNKKKK